MCYRIETKATGRHLAEEAFERFFFKKKKYLNSTEICSKTHHSDITSTPIKTQTIVWTNDSLI